MREGDGAFGGKHRTSLSTGIKADFDSLHSTLRRRTIDAGRSQSHSVSEYVRGDLATLAADPLALHVTSSFASRTTERHQCCAYLLPGICPWPDLNPLDF
jgi:hypothetical protein